MLSQLVLAHHCASGACRVSKTKRKKRFFSAQKATHSWKDNDYSFQTEKEGKEKTSNYLFWAPAVHLYFAFSPRMDVVNGAMLHR